MSNKSYKNHISYKILSIYALVFILLSVCSVIILNITAEKQTDNFIRPIIEKKIQTLQVVYNELGFKDMMFMIKNQQDVYDFIVKKNDEVVYTSFKYNYKIEADDDRDSDFVIYEFDDGTLFPFDHVGIPVKLDDSTELTVLLEVEELDLTAHITEVIVQILMATYLIGLVTVGALIYKLRHRLNSINNDLDTITQFTSFSKRIDVEDNKNEFDELAVNINKVLNHIEQLSDKKQMMINNIAHDLRTPLTRLSNTLAQEFKKHNIDCAEEVQTQVTQLLNIFDSVLRISKLDSGQPINLNKVNLAEIIEDVYDLYQPLAEDKNLKFTLENADVEINADSGLLFQALANCIDNAIKYTQTGEISLCVNKLSDSTVIKITDTGIGIPKEKTEDVLQLFYRLDSARTSSGTGLGLSMVNSIVKAHNAKLEIQQNHPQGTIIKITI
jgi:signal transduction histidine kinase